MKGFLQKILLLAICCCGIGFAMAQNDNAQEENKKSLSPYGEIINLSKVAVSGSFHDLVDTPVYVLRIGHDTLYLSNNLFVKLPAESQVLRISNDTIYLTGGSFVKLPADFSGDYSDLSNKPTIPEAANDATLTIQINSADIGTFSANASADATINVEVPTTVASLSDASDYAKVAGNTYSGIHNFTGAATTVSEGFTFGTSPCTQNAVNACDLQNVFDSIQRTFAAMQQQINTLRDTLNRLKRATDPEFQSMSFSATANSITPTATFIDNGADITSYIFYMADNSSMTDKTSQTVTTNSCTFTGLSPYTTYYFTATATNLKGTSEESTVNNFTTEANNPTLATPTISNVTDSSMDVSCTVSDIGGGSLSSATIKAYTNSEMTTGEISGSATVSGTSITGSLSGLSANTQYWVKVIATNAGGKTGSNSASATTAYATPTLSEPTLAATDSSIEVSFSVTDNGGGEINSVTISAYTTSEMTGTPAATATPSTVTSNPIKGTITGLSANTQYWVKVTATNAGSKTGTNSKNTTTDYGAPILANDTVVTPAATSISVSGTVTTLGGAASTSVKLCAYTNSDYSDTPICGSDSVITSAPKDYKVSVTGLTKNTHYYLAVIANNGQKTDTVKTEATTLNITVTSNRTDTIANCGSIDTTVTYTAAVTGTTPTTYAWKVNGTDSTAVTGNVLMVHYTDTTAGYNANTIICTVNGIDDINDTITTVLQVKEEPTLGLCEECNDGFIYVKTLTNAASIVWRNSSNDSVSNSTTSLAMSTSIPAGIYTATAKSSDGCTVTRTATLGNYMAHPCTVASLNAGTSLGSGKYANKEYGTGTQLDSVSDHEGNVYRVVQIGEGANAQCWLAENMRCTTSPSTGTTILHEYGEMSALLESKSACYYTEYSNGSYISYVKYGGLYNWCAAVDTFYAAGGYSELSSGNTGRTISWSCTMPSGSRRGICPKGWHIPTDVEWTAMLTAEEASEEDGTGAGKLVSGCDWTTYDGGNTDSYNGNYSYSDRASSGFSALPAGYFDPDLEAAYSYYHGVGNIATFWSVTHDDTYNAYTLSLYSSAQSAYTYLSKRWCGRSVRCVRDVSGVTMVEVTNTDSTFNTLSISASYIASQTVTATICAYTDASCTSPVGTCATDVTYSSSSITGTVTGLTPGTQYYVKVTATTAGGGTDSKIAGPFGTPLHSLTFTSYPAFETIDLCGGSVAVTYTATVGNGGATSYTWSTSGGDTTTTSNSYTVTYNSAGTYAVTCTAQGVNLSATKSVTITQDQDSINYATLGLCETCNEGAIKMKTGYCTSLCWVNISDATINGTVSSIPADSIILRVDTDSPAGVYTITGINRYGCTVTRTATLGNVTAHPCTVTLKNGNEMGSTTTTIDSVSDHEGNWYRVVQIGTQCWLKENMRATTEPGSTTSIIVSSGTSVSDPMAYQSSNSAKYGLHYNFAAAMNITTTDTSFTYPHRGICPEGWHIPTDAEWTAMNTSAGVGVSSGGTGLGKLTGGCDWTSSTSNPVTSPGNYYYSERNSSGFSALPAGFFNNGSYRGAGITYFWSATSSATSKAWLRILNGTLESVLRAGLAKSSGISVRCVRDN